MTEEVKETAEKVPVETMDELLRRFYPNKSDAWYEAKKQKTYKDMIHNTITRKRHL